ncbi:hypothetical protein ABEB36_003603 [Hypothenemus hampei]|uniref:Uncharacterized protein n=1 Tax=Hypothenemus hampei TaxID=57062 RepID=A0ABD1F9P6_HYPHA
MIRKVDEKATQLHAIASLKVLLDATKPQNGAATSSAASYVATATVDKQETTLIPSNLSLDMPNGIPSAVPIEVGMEAFVHVGFRAYTSDQKANGIADREY